MKKNNNIFIVKILFSDSSLRKKKVETFYIEFPLSMVETIMWHKL